MKCLLCCNDVNIASHTLLLMISLFPLSLRDFFQAVQVAHRLGCKATRMLLQKQTNCLPVFVRHLESAFTAYEKKVTYRKGEHSKNLVLIECPGHLPPEVQVLNDCHKLYEGSLTFTTSMPESVKEKGQTNFPQANKI